MSTVLFGLRVLISSVMLIATHTFENGSTFLNRF